MNENVALGRDTNVYCLSKKEKLSIGKELHAPTLQAALAGRLHSRVQRCVRSKSELADRNPAPTLKGKSDKALARWLGRIRQRPDVVNINVSGVGSSRTVGITLRGVEKVSRSSDSGSWDETAIIYTLLVFVVHKRKETSQPTEIKLGILRHALQRSCERGLLDATKTDESILTFVDCEAVAIARKCIRFCNVEGFEVRSGEGAWVCRLDEANGMVHVVTYLTEDMLVA